MSNNADAHRAQISRPLFVRESRVLELVMRGKARAASDLYTKDRRNDLFDIVAIGDAEQIEPFLLSSPNAVHRLCHVGWSALYVAATCGDLTSASILLDSGANPDLASDDSRLETPLHAAARANDERMVELLLHRGAERTSLDVDGRTPGVIAAESGCWKAAAALARASVLSPAI